MSSSSESPGSSRSISRSSSSEDFSLISDSDSHPNKIDVEELSIQKLDISRTSRYLNLKKGEIEKLKFKDIFDRIVTIFNESLTKHKYEAFTYNFKTDSEFKLKVFTQPIIGKTKLIAHLDKTGKKLKPNANTTCLFFFYRKNPEKEIFAATSGQAFSVVCQCIDYTFPIQVAQKCLDPNRILEITRRHLVGSHLKETLINPGGHVIISTSSLYFLVEAFKSVVKINPH